MKLKRPPMLVGPSKRHSPSMVRAPDPPVVCSNFQRSTSSKSCAACHASHSVSGVDHFQASASYGFIFLNASEADASSEGAVEHWTKSRAVNATAPWA